MPTAPSSTSSQPPPRDEVGDQLAADAALMTQVARGDAAAFRALSDQHLGAIVTYATRVLKSAAEGEEVAQETFLRAWQKADTYTPQRKVVTWLYRIAHNLAVDRLRKRKTQGDSLVLDEERDAAPGSMRPSRAYARKQQAMTVQAALDSLPERQREALVLCHEQGLSNPEIGEVMNCGVEAVESLLARGRRKLRELLSPESTGSI